MTQPPLAIVRAWQEKSAQVSNQSKDLLFAAVTKGFDAMAALLTKDSYPAYVQQVLGYLNVDRIIALQFDKAKDDSLRDIMHGLLESMHVSLNEWNEERNQRMKTGEISTQTEEFTMSFLGPIIPPYEVSLPMDNQTPNNLSTLSNPSPVIPIEPKEEPIDIHQSLPQDYQISASELMRDEEMIMKEEMDNQNSDPISPDSMDCISTNPDFTHSLLHTLHFNPREEPTDQTVPQDNQMPFLLFPPPSIIPPQEAVPIDFVHPSENMSTMGNFTPFNPKIKKPVETQEEINNRDSVGEDRLFEDQGYDNVMQPSDFVDNQMNFDDEFSGDYDPPLANPPNEVSMSTNDMNESGHQPQDTSDSVKVEKMKRSSRDVSRAMQYAESMEDSDDDDGPLMKKSRSDSMRKDDNKTKGKNKSGCTSKKLTVSKENATDLECSECEFSTRIVHTWIIHLRNKHSTTPSLAGLALLCECGHESLSHIHSRKCNRGNTTVIRKRDSPIGRLHDEKVTPQCVLCEAYPRTACGYTRHLHIHHKSTLLQNGIYLMCSCGVEVRSDRSFRHLEECNPGQFTLHKLGDK